MDTTEQDAAAREREESDRYLAKLKLGALVVVAAVAAAWLYLQFAESPPARSMKAQLQPMAAQLDAAERSGDRASVEVLDKQTAQILAEYNKLDDTKKAAIYNSSLRFCMEAAGNVGNGVGEIMETGKWQSREAYQAAIAQCR
jgi:hypothetical protein